MILTGLVILSGIRSIGKFTSFLVSFMIVTYVGTALIVLLMNTDKIPHAFSLIFYHAFNPTAATGGVVGCRRNGCRRYALRYCTWRISMSLA